MTWIRCLAIGAILGIVPLGLCAGSPAKEKFLMTGQEKKLLELTNQERKKKNLPPLTPSPLLFKVARAHSVNMARQGKMEHVLDGKNPYQRIKAAGYRYSYAGENIAMGEVSCEEIVKAWMESPKHRDNILGKNYSEIGLGIIANKKGELFFTQVFARPR